jgi:hypothetical protein
LQNPFLFGRRFGFRDLQHVNLVRLASARSMAGSSPATWKVHRSCQSAKRS